MVEHQWCSGKRNYVLFHDSNNKRLLLFPEPLDSAAAVQAAALLFLPCNRRLRVENCFLHTHVDGGKLVLLLHAYIVRPTRLLLLCFQRSTETHRRRVTLVPFCCSLFSTNV